MKQKRQIAACLIVLVISALAACAGTQTAGTFESEFNRGMSLFNRGKFAEAVPAFEKATELQANHADAYLYLGRSLISLGQWREALPPLRAAYRLAPEKAEKEAGELILDLIIRHAGEIDMGTRSEFEQLIGTP
jgi:tetratricopeptide (TPR) repeat protein